MNRSQQLTPPVNDRDYMQGDPNAPVTLVEYADFECPYCGEAYGAIKYVQQELGKNLCFVFRNFPLVESHPHALIAAVAAEAAGEQGKFWPMHDMLFENQAALDVEDIMSYAEEIGLDLQQFSHDLQSRRLVEKAMESRESGVESGVEATPTFFLNGSPYEGGWEPEELLDGVRQAMAAAARR